MLSIINIIAAGIGNEALTVLESNTEWIIAFIGINNNNEIPTPNNPEQSPMINVSALNTWDILCFDAPIARKIPISLVRSITDMNVIIPIIIEETISETATNAISTYDITLIIVVTEDNSIPI